MFQKIDLYRVSGLLIFAVVFFEHRAVGIFLRNVEIVSGHVTLTFDEDLFLKSQLSSSSLFR